MEQIKTKTILIFAYYSFRDPVFQSAVLPYFKNFPQKNTYCFYLLTFEQEKYSMSAQEAKRVKADLLKHNIIWKRRQWHSGYFKLPKKLYDLLAGIIASVWLVKVKHIDCIYSEGFPGAVIAHFVSKICRIAHIVHTFEPHTDYMVEGGVWKKTSWEAKFLRYFEAKVGENAYAILTATDAYIQQLKKHGIKAQIYRVPSCVDIEHFKFNQAARQEIRDALSIQHDEIVIVYIGKTGGMYWDKEIFEFFSLCLQENRLFRFLFFTTEPPENIATARIKYGIPEDKLYVKYVRREDMPKYLSAADWGLVPVCQYPSKRFCSPIKDGEYWACGLPLIIPENISDDFSYAIEHEIGVVLKSTAQDDMKSGIECMKKFSMMHGKEEVAVRARSFVLADRNVKIYQLLYKEMFDTL